VGKGAGSVPAALRPVAPYRFCEAGSAYGRRAAHGPRAPSMTIDPAGVEKVTFQSGISGMRILRVVAETAINAKFQDGTTRRGVRAGAKWRTL